MTLLKFCRGEPKNTNHFHSRNHSVGIAPRSLPIAGAGTPQGTSAKLAPISGAPKGILKPITSLPGHLKPPLVKHGPLDMRRVK
jgi:hypothetical protein